MKKILLLSLSLILLTSCEMNPCSTAECYQSKIEYQKAQAEIEFERKALEAKLKDEYLEKNRAYELERLKIQAEIEKNKPTEVKVQELKNEEMSLGEGITTAAGIGAATLGGLKVLDILTK